MLNPTPPQHLVNAQGQPYFLWDSEMTLEIFKERLVLDLLQTGAPE